MEDRELMKQEEIRKCTKVMELFRSMMDELGDMCVVYDERFGFIVLEYYMDGYFENNSNYNSARSVCMRHGRGIHLRGLLMPLSFACNSGNGEGMDMERWGGRLFE